jgi:hypothetical protein
MKKLIAIIFIICEINSYLYAEPPVQQSGPNQKVADPIYIVDRLYVHTDQLLCDLSGKISDESYSIVKTKIVNLQKDSQFNGKSLIKDFKENHQIEDKNNGYLAWFKSCSLHVVVVIAAGIVVAKFLK